MKTQNIERYLNSFGKYIVQQSRTNLTKGKKNANKSLYNSINFKVTTDANGFSVQFYMNSYGTFVDKGVSGNEEKQSYKDYTGKSSSSPYSYKSKQPPSGIIEKWIKKRGIKGRDEKGRFIKHKSLAFLIARSIKAKGIKSTSFFQRPLQLGLKRFSKDLLRAVKEDIIEGLTTVK
tara:strand:- start:748 stop:1275 length:528 start_codon:yes stop_codon:yes gene_type:complete